MTGAGDGLANRADVDALLGALAGLGLPGTDQADPRPDRGPADRRRLRTGHGADVGGFAGLPADPLDLASWRSLLTGVAATRLEGSLAHAVTVGALPVTDAQLAQTLEVHRRAMALALLLERELLHLAAAFDAAGVAVRVMKGTAVAHLDEADPARRGFGDLDLLVAGDDLARAAAIVTAAGGHRRYTGTRPAYDRRVGKGASFAFERNAEVDLHRTLAPGPFGLRIDLAELAAHTEPFALGGRTLLALDRPSRFIHAAAHALLGGSEPRLSALRDVALTAPVDLDEHHRAVDRARRWGLDPVVAAAVTSAAATLGWRPADRLAAWATGTAPTRRERRWLAAYQGGQRSSARLTLHGLGAVRGGRDKVAYAWAAGAHALDRVRSHRVDVEPTAPAPTAPDTALPAEPAP